MDKLWLKSYPPGVPAEIDLSNYQSLAQLMEESFKKYAGRPAFVCMGKSILYAELDAMSLQIAAWLQTKGLPKGARVAVMMPNVLQYPAAMVGIIRAGYTVVNVNPLYTPRELEHQLKDSGAEAIFILENFATTLEQVISKTAVKHVVVASMGDLLGTVKGTIVNLVVRRVKKMVPAFSLPGSISFRQLLGESARLRLSPVQITLDDLAFLQYTGGTTGVSKGAMLTHRNIVANILQADAWFKPELNKVDSSVQMTMVCALPLYHIFALTVCGLMGMRMGFMNLLIPNPRDIPGFIKELGKYPADFFPAVNTLFNGLLNNPDFAQLDFSKLKVSMGGGMAVQKAVAERWQKVTGCVICEGYGLSETSPIASANPLETGRLGTIGLPLPSTEIVILDDAGLEVPLGQSGEIGIRGPQVMKGYWQNQAETDKCMTEDGFFKSGDIGVMDESGFTTIVDRKKDMILVSGFNVYPNEIEGVVAMHPGVLECACVGVPDEHSGEAVKLYIVKKDQALTEQDILDFCKHELTGYKKPRHIEFRTELPKTNVGKILRRQLRDEKQAA
ncbi:long-chain acyl-CoA synthetase [Oxalobacteraceae bacterium GrIS 2.11]